MDPEDRQGLWRRIRRFLEPQTATEVATLIGTSMTPGVGTALDVADVAAGIQDRDPMRIGIGAIAAGIPFVSAAMLRSLGSGAKALLKRAGSGPTGDLVRGAGRALDQATEPIQMMLPVRHKTRVDKILGPPTRHHTPYTHRKILPLVVRIPTARCLGVWCQGHPWKQVTIIRRRHRIPDFTTKTYSQLTFV